MIPLNVLYHGTDTSSPKRIKLRAGPLSMEFDPDSGSLREIRWGESEILHGVYVAVRDRNWGTVLPALQDLQIESHAESFRVSFEARCLRDEIDFTWKGTILGESDGAVRFSMTGTARSTFLRNRIGFCVLYPSSCAGQPCTVEKPDGTVERGTLPDLISPGQPFKQICTFAHQLVPGVKAEVRFEGDVFEMEDERNWTDSAFKIYGTPLELPFPVVVPSGASIAQTVTLQVRQRQEEERERVIEEKGTTRGEAGERIEPEASLDPARDTELVEVRARGSSVSRSNNDAPSAPSSHSLLLPVSITIGSTGRTPPLPRIGFGLASHDEPLSPEEITRIKALVPAHLRVDLSLAGTGWRAKLSQAAAQARAIGTSLETAIFVSDRAPEEFLALASELEKFHTPVGSWLLFHKERHSVPENLVELARARLRANSSSAKFGSGTNANFAELNRNRPPAHALDLVCYSINPQVHTFDDASVMETLKAQAETVRSARSFAGGVPVAVTPITLRPRFNAVATGPELSPPPGELPWPVDPRQMSLFGAAWTLGSLKRLSEAGAHSLTYYETTGWRGVMETRCGSPLPERFRSFPGGVFPMYHVFADVAEFAKGALTSLASSDPRRVDGLAFDDGAGVHFLLANLTSIEQPVTIAIDEARFHTRMLDETNVLTAMQSPELYRQTGNWTAAMGGFVKLNLRPYAVARIDVEP